MLFVLSATTAAIVSRPRGATAQSADVTSSLPAMQENRYPSRLGVVEFMMRAPVR